jgi:hypothetical protein
VIPFWAKDLKIVSADTAATVCQRAAENSPTGDTFHPALLTDLQSYRTGVSAQAPPLV